MDTRVRELSRRSSFEPSELERLTWLQRTRNDGTERVRLLSRLGHVAARQVLGGAAVEAPVPGLLEVGEHVAAQGTKTIAVVAASVLGELGGALERGSAARELVDELITRLNRLGSGSCKVRRGPQLAPLLLPSIDAPGLDRKVARINNLAASWLMGAGHYAALHPELGWDARPDPHFMVHLLHSTARTLRKARRLTEASIRTALDPGRSDLPLHSDHEQLRGWFVSMASNDVQVSAAARLLELAVDWVPAGAPVHTDPRWKAVRSARERMRQHGPILAFPARAGRPSDRFDGRLVARLSRRAHQMFPRSSVGRLRSDDVAGSCLMAGQLLLVARARCEVRAVELASDGVHRVATLATVEAEHLRRRLLDRLAEHLTER